MDFIKRHSSVGGSLSNFQTVERKLTSHVPDLVVFDKNPENIPHVQKFDGVLLFADVSGFTALTEKYTQNSEKGTDALTVTLNDYIGKIVKYILQAGGDILKFAGDAILAVWKVKQRPDLAHAVLQAAQCSLTIQDKCDNQATDVGVKLRVKIAISAGKIYATFVGSPESYYFVMAGKPVGEVNAAEKFCTAGKVVLSPNALELADRDNIIVDPLADRFSLVRYLRREPRKHWKDYVEQPDSIAEHSGSAIRVALRIFPNKIRECMIRKYITTVVERKLDDGQPLQFLSEMRQCSIAFINMAFNLNERDRSFHEKQMVNMQTAFNIVYTATMDMQGSLNKIFMFDKGCTFLVIFGLPGDKHEQEPAHALQAAWTIRHSLVTQLDTVTLASIGVTTGPVFCGVIGHDERHEYTVIGQKVNLAARLMMHYPDRVSCDQETQYSSKFSNDMFKKLPFVQMKGVGEVTVYEYMQGERRPVGTTEFLEPEYPILGREDEIEVFMNEINALKNNQVLGEERRVIVFEGEAGYGKTRFMEEITWRASVAGIRVVSFTVSMNDVNSPYFAVRLLLELLLGVEHNAINNELQITIARVAGYENNDNLCLLNDIASVHFPITEKVSEMTSAERRKAMHRLLVEIVQKVSRSGFLLFALDDAQNVDSHSWGFLSKISKAPRSLCVLAMRPFGPEKPICEEAKQILYHPKTMYVKLDGIASKDIGALACQFLHVKRLQKDFELFMINKCHGVPSWCEQLVREMQQSGLILTVPITESKARMAFQFAVPFQHLTKKNTNRKSISVKCELPIGQDQKLLLRNDSIDNAGLDITTETVDKEATSSPDSTNREVKTEDAPVEDIEEHPHSIQEKNAKQGKLHSWADRLTGKKSSKGLIDFLRHGSKGDVTKLSSSKENFHYAERAEECILKPGFQLNKFPVPASIRGFALARLDRMKPFEQVLVKTAAVIGTNFSRKMLAAVVPGFHTEKFNNSLIRLIRTRVFGCASISETSGGRRKSLSIDRVSLGVSCSCHEDNVEEADIKLSNIQEIEAQIASRCEQMTFRNSLVKETAYNLWLRDQKKKLNEDCANYLESKVNEILITGKSDEAIIKQYRLAKSEEFVKTKSSVNVSQKESAPCVKGRSWHTTGALMSGVPSGKFDISTQSQNSLKDGELGIPQANEMSLFVKRSSNGSRRVSRSAVIGRMAVERVGATNDKTPPLSLTEENIPKDYIEANDKEEVENYLSEAKSMCIQEDASSASTTGKDNRRLSYSPLWLQSTGIQLAYDKLVNKTEQDIKKMKKFTLDNVLKTPYEVHNSLALIYPQLMNHWKKAKNTSKTIEFLRKAGESLIATLNLTDAWRYLDEASDIIENLSKGNDIITSLFDVYDPAGIEDFKVLSVDKETKASVENLLGQVLYQQGKLEPALTHFNKALKILNCPLPKYNWTIGLKTWKENRRQIMHKRYPARYIGKVKSSVANKYVEQVRSLSYVWQILMNINNLPHRIMLSKLVALMQVNRAESADDDLQELITSYTYMMQIHQLGGDFVDSAFYENKATVRCLELPHKLTASDLYITGHLHLVSCSVRICQGKLSLGVASGYRAYSVACSLGDADMKLIVLPLLAQIHLIAGQPNACVEVLHRLKIVSQNCIDDQGLTSYYTTCMDLLLDGAYSLEDQAACVEYLQSSEGIDIGEAPRFYVRTSMAVWCYRQKATANGHAWLMLADTAKPDVFDSFHSVRAVTRLIEARLLCLKHTSESYGVKTKESGKVNSKCKENLNLLCSIVKSFPVFYPRYLHLKAYYDILFDLSKQAKEKLLQATNMSKYCGNVLDGLWAKRSQNVWFSSGQGATEDECYWVNNCMKLPKWNDINNPVDADHLYSFQPIFNA